MNGISNKQQEQQEMLTQDHLLESEPLQVQVF